jgi:hypothetical protein
MAEIVPATAEMFKQLSDEPAPKTVRAIAAVEGERVLGIGGFYVENGRLVMFAEICRAARSEMRRHKRTLIRAARTLMGMAAAQKLPVYAEADAEIPGSDVLLQHLGFEEQFKGVYQWK